MEIPLTNTRNSKLLRADHFFLQIPQNSQFTPVRSLHFAGSRLSPGSVTVAIVVKHFIDEVGRAKHGSITKITHSAAQNFSQRQGSFGGDHFFDLVATESWFRLLTCVFIGGTLLAG